MFRRLKENDISETKQVGDIVKFKAVDVAVFAAGVADDNFLYNKRMNTWNDHNILKDQIGIILEGRSIENTIKPGYQKYYQGKEWKAYFWYCFKTAKVYLVYQRELI